MFDFEVNRANGKIFFGEMNFRCGGPHYSYFASGVNLPEISVKAICGNPLPDIPKINMNKIFLNDQCVWEDYEHGFLNKKDVLALYKNSDILLFDHKDDPKPFKIFLDNIKDRIYRRKKKFIIDKIKKIVNIFVRKK